MFASRRWWWELTGLIKVAFRAGCVLFCVQMLDCSYPLFLLGIAFRFCGLERFFLRMAYGQSLLYFRCVPSVPNKLGVCWWMRPRPKGPAGSFSAESAWQPLRPTDYALFNQYHLFLHIISNSASSFVRIAQSGARITDIISCSISG